VSNASDDLPDPDRPVKTTSASRGTSIETFFRLCSRAPVEDLGGAADRLAGELARLTPEHRDIAVERIPGGPTFQAGQLPFLRLREVVYHHGDLDAGFGFGDLSPELVRMFLDEEVARLRSAPLAPAVRLRTDEGEDHTLGEASVQVSGSRAALLGWLARGLTEGVRCDGPLPTLPSGG
jgi:maleylpyruvate isomerase